MSVTAANHKPTHGGYPGVVPEPRDPALNLRLKTEGYKVRAFGPYLPGDRPRLSIVGTESEEFLQVLAEARPETIYFVTEEAFV